MSSVVGDLVDAGEASIKKLAACAPKIDAAGDDAAAIKAVNNDATRFIREADGTLRKLEAEAKVAAPSQRREVMEQLAQLKASLQTARSALQKANDGKARASLLKPADRARALDNAASDKLQSASEKSSASTLKLQQAQQVLSETQDLGVNVMDTMTTQREALLRATDKASNTNSLTQRARGLMRMMIVRARTNVALLILTIIVLIASIGAVAYFGYLKK